MLPRARGSPAGPAGVREPQGERMAVWPAALRTRDNSGGQSLHTHHVRGAFSWFLQRRRSPHNVQSALLKHTVQRHSAPSRCHAGRPCLVASLPLTPEKCRVPIKPPFSPPPPPSTTPLLSVSLGFPLVDISQEWNGTLCALLF